MIYRNKICRLVAFLLLPVGFGIATAQKNAPTKTDRASSPAVEDISGMYSFLKEGEFVQIDVEQEGVSGYISRLGDQESDRGSFLDQFFSKASVQGHEVSFTTKVLHGVWFEFKGRFERGSAKSKSEDGYYVLRGTLAENVSDADNKTTRRTREVALKMLGQPQDDEPDQPVPPKKKH